MKVHNEAVIVAPSGARMEEWQARFKTMIRQHLRAGPTSLERMARRAAEIVGVDVVRMGEIERVGVGVVRLRGRWIFEHVDPLVVVAHKALGKR